MGHLSGPYTGADILTRYLKLKGNEVFYMSGADDHQSYVPFKAGQLENLLEKRQIILLMKLKKH